MPRIHTIEIRLREFPADLSPRYLKKLELDYSLELMTALFRTVGLMSFEQTSLHTEPDRMATCAKLEEFDRAIQLIGELGAGISNHATTILEEIIPES
jgi:hypothetical protein